jgi:hypothetical protein
MTRPLHVKRFRTCRFSTLFESIFFEAGQPYILDQDHKARFSTLFESIFFEAYPTCWLVSIYQAGRLTQ